MARELSSITAEKYDMPARILAVQESLVTIECGYKNGEPQALRKNEVVFIEPRRIGSDGRSERLQAEILRVSGKFADVQVFEDTSGVAVGDPVVQTGDMLSVVLGPGLLGQVYDGLQNPLQSIATKFGTFLPRGVDINAVDHKKKWPFVPSVEMGAQLVAGDVLGTVQEGAFSHKIMVPFDTFGEVEVTWILDASVTVDTPVVRVRNQHGKEYALNLLRHWPVRRPLPSHMLREGLCQRIYPHTPMSTTIRLIDTFFPIAQGGTSCIPGPFGSGKTVLQHLLAKHSAVDIVIIVACGERAGEVVETITEFPRLKDPRTGGPLSDRTIVICNTSSMPVAAREASMYTGVTLGEYYRQMGYRVLLLADSTSRWAQAMRETSGRLEEIPGEEAFPAYLDSAIRNMYERAGVILQSSGSEGSLTMIGTVSPAGGNFDEPVTQSTLNTVKNFLGLSYDRAYKRFYPAIDPLISWSRYLEQLTPWYSKQISSDWAEKVGTLQKLLVDGNAVEQMMLVSGEEGVSLDDYVLFQKAQLVDMVYLQQDAFDTIDASVSFKRQQFTLDLIYQMTRRNYPFEDKPEALTFFTELTGLFKNLNYTDELSPDYDKYIKTIQELPITFAARSTS